MKIRDVMGSAASGSKGSLTASRNRGGQYLRNRTVPTNPNTSRQANARESLGSLAPQWSSLLSEAQRNGWNLYANNVVMIDTLGQPIKLSGINHFIRSNAPRVQVSLPVIDDPPTIFNIGDTPIISSFAAAQTPASPDLAIVIDGSILAPASADDVILVYLGRPQNGGVAFFRGPYRAFAPGGVAAPPAGDFHLTFAITDLPFVMTAGQAEFVRMQVSRADGRLSADAQARAIVTPT